MLEVQELTVSFGSTVALDAVSFTVPVGTVVAVLGPSGCGKSTLLRVVAGLQRPDSGSVTWDGTRLDDIPPHRRGFGLMFQDYALFPHMTIGQNTAFGLRMQRLATDEIERRVAAALDQVGLGGMHERPIGTLSGGEQQRVAFARALAPRPRMLMLDEPIGALDRTLRERLLLELTELFGALDTTVLYVTHDQAEAFAVVDEVVVMRSGQIVQQGTPERLWHRPANEFVARFLGFPNVVSARVADGEADTGWARFPVLIATRGDVRVVRSDAIAVSADASNAGPIPGRVTGRTFHAGRYHLLIEVAGGPVLEAETRHGPQIGAEATLTIDPDGVVVLQDDGDGGGGAGGDAATS